MSKEPQKLKREKGSGWSASVWDARCGSHPSPSLPLPVEGRGKNVAEAGWKISSACWSWGRVYHKFLRASSPHSSPPTLLEERTGLRTVITKIGHTRLFSSPCALCGERFPQKNSRLEPLNLDGFSVRPPASSFSPQRGEGLRMRGETTEKHQRSQNIGNKERSCQEKVLLTYENEN
jgi:hypothetical protein